eukprot:gb/GEZN01011117.1/.p1 GENE.gb/GEZN01011117.1/~~gb/GEZN01011117.1/.p1  ORF type:complete len:279 (-),score=25.05 gb/GEZN01011117.1/:231-1067(-)
MLTRGVLARTGLARAVSARTPAILSTQTRAFASEVGSAGGQGGELSLDQERKKVYDSWSISDPKLIAEIEADRAVELADREKYGVLGDPRKFESTDNYFEKMQNEPRGDPTNRFYTYAVLGTTQMMTLIAGRFVTTKIGGLFWMTEHTAAQGSVECDFSKIQEGDTMAVSWRGRAVYIRWRTPLEIAKAREGDAEDLKDPEPDSARVKPERPEILIVSGVCTHLGCIPITNEGEWGGWFCPCHGSHYDLSGRIRKGPAPLNLEVPPYTFLSDTVVKLG